jgi:hypothetical protein
MKKLSNILVILSVLATPCMVVQSYQTRGYLAVGGEWLLIPLTILIILLISQIKSLWKECIDDTKERRS